MLTYEELKNTIEELNKTPARSSNIFSLMKKGYKFFIQELPKDLKDYSKGYLAKENYKRFKYSVSIFEEYLEPLKYNFYAMLIEYKEEDISYKVEIALNKEEKTFFMYDSTKSDFLSFIKESVIEKQIKEYLEAYLVELEKISNSNTLGNYQRLYFNNFLEALKDATEENINDFLLLWESGLISAGARYMWSNPLDYAINDFKAFLDTIIRENQDHQDRLLNGRFNPKTGERDINGLIEDERILEEAKKLLSSEDLARFNNLVKKLEHAPGTTYLSPAFKECFSDDEKELLKHALHDEPTEKTPLIVRLLGNYLLVKEDKGILESEKASLKTLSFISSLEAKGEAETLGSLLLSILSAPKEENKPLEEEKGTTYIKNPDYLASIRSTFPFLSLVESKKDKEIVEQYINDSQTIKDEIFRLEEELKKVNIQLQDFNAFKDDRELLAVLRERKERLEEAIREERLKLKPLSKNIVSIDSTYYLNKGFIDTYKSERIGYYELLNPGRDTLLLLNENALRGINDTTQALLLWIVEKITETEKNPIYLDNEELISFYRAQKKTRLSEEATNYNKEIEDSRELVYRHLTYLKGMQILELSSVIKDAEDLLKKIKAKKDITLIGTILRGEGERGKITIYIDAYFFDAIKKHQGTIRLGEEYKKLPPRARLLYVALEELTYMNSKINGARFNYSYEAISKRVASYIDKNKYTGKNKKRLYEAINHDAEKIEELGLIRIDHLLESVEDNLSGVMLYSFDLYEQRKHDHAEAMRKAYLKHERQNANTLIEHKNKK